PDSLRKQFCIIKLMVLYEWDSCNRLFSFYKMFYSVVYRLCYDGRISGRRNPLVFSPNLYITIKVQDGSNCHTQSNLSQYLEPTGQPVFITLLVWNTLLLRNFLGS